MPRAEGKFFSFWFNKLKLLERNNTPEGNITVQPIKYCQGQQNLSCSPPPPVLVIVEKRVSCKADLDITLGSYSMPRIRKRTFISFTTC